MQLTAPIIIMYLTHVYLLSFTSSSPIVPCLFIIYHLSYSHFIQSFFNCFIHYNNIIHFYIIVLYNQKLNNYDGTFSLLEQNISVK